SPPELSSFRPAPGTIRWIPRTRRRSACTAIRMCSHATSAPHPLRRAAPVSSRLWRWSVSTAICRRSARSIRCSRTKMAALRSGGRGSAPYLGKNLAADKLDAGEDLVLAHPRPTHAHREVVDAAAMLGDQHLDDVFGRAHREPLGGQRAELLLGGGVR